MNVFHIIVCIQFSVQLNVINNNNYYHGHDGYFKGPILYNFLDFFLGVDVLKNKYISAV